jgi:hypothetical protein
MFRADRLRESLPPATGDIEEGRENDGKASWSVKDIEDAIQSAESALTIMADPMALAIELYGEDYSPEQFDIASNDAKIISKYSSSGETFKKCSLEINRKFRDLPSNDGDEQTMFATRRKLPQLKKLQIQLCSQLAVLEKIKHSRNNASRSQAVAEAENRADGEPAGPAGSDGIEMDEREQDGEENYQPGLIQSMVQNAYVRLVEVQTNYLSRFTAAQVAMAALGAVTAAAGVYAYNVGALSGGASRSHVHSHRSHVKLQRKRSPKPKRATQRSPKPKRKSAKRSAKRSQRSQKSATR